MNDSNFDTRAFDPMSIFEAYRHAFSPVIKAQEEGIKTFDRLGRYQYAVAGDYLDWGIAQTKAALDATTPEELVSKHVELNAALGEKLRSRAQEWASSATDAHAQAGFTQVASEATTKVAGMAKNATIQSADAVKEATVKGADIVKETSIKSAETFREATAKGTNAGKRESA